MDLLFMDGNADLSRFLVPNPYTGFNREFLEFELNQWLAKKITDHPEGLASGKRIALIVICAMTSISFLLKNLFLYLARYVMAPIRNEMITVLRKTTFDQILKLPNSYFSDERKGDIMSRMTSDVKEVEWGLVSLQALIREPLTIIIFLSGLLFIDVELTLIILLLAPVTSIIMAKIGRSLKRTSKKAQEKIGEVISMFEETLSGLKIIKAFAAEDIIFSKFNKANVRFFDLANRVTRKNALSSPLSEFVGITIFCVVLYIGGNRVFEGTFQGSTFTTFLLYLYGLITPIKALSNAYNELQKSTASLERIEKIIDAPVLIKNVDNPLKIKDFKQSISFKNVSFSYETDIVLNDISFTFEKGKTYALVGHSGSGKSTLADMIPRFQDVNDGEVLIDGVNIKEVDFKDLRRLTGIVTQDSILFNDSVRNNLTFGELNISDEDIIAALKIANAYDFTMDLPNGLETMIGDGGGKLSGGQKQRLCIARAVLKNPPILILDEATSALDTESENIVQEALNNVMKNRTAIVIAHRLSTIKNSDCIVVMEKGKIIETGTHDDLIAQNGAYFKLVNMQKF
jgi:subfamily B ATP-binding cassette protein MsbA